MSSAIPRNVGSTTLRELDEVSILKPRPHRYFVRLPKLPKRLRRHLRGPPHIRAPKRNIIQRSQHFLSKGWAFQQAKIEDAPRLSSHAPAFVRTNAKTLGILRNRTTFPSTRQQILLPRATNQLKEHNIMRKRHHEMTLTKHARQRDM